MASEDSPIDVTRLNQHGTSWTKPKHVEPRDLALMYYLARYKAVCCRPRASSLLILASPPEVRRGSPFTAAPLERSACVSAWAA